MADQRAVGAAFLHGGLSPQEAASSLADRLGHRVRDAELLGRALTHASAQAGATYQRLEFLGDRVLGLVIADLLYRAFPHAEEGELSPRLTRLVRRETCAEVAREAGLAPFIRLGAGERAADGPVKEAILSDVCEAVLGALYVDGGLPAASGFVERYWGPRLREKVGRLKDAKTALQEWAHGQGLLETPLYREVGRSGPDHAPLFTVAVEIAGRAPAEGSGASKRLAEQDAAAALLVREGVWENGER